MKLWIIPGAPLPSGQGWRVWCSREGEGRFAPPSVNVWRQEKSVPVEIHWELLPVLPGGKRRMGILSVKLSQGLPEGEIFKVQIGEIYTVVRDGLDFWNAGALIEQHASIR